LPATDAIRSLDRALAINAQAGASWDAARVRGRLRRLGVRRRIAVPERPATGWEALTSAEASIARPGIAASLILKAIETTWG
jgi:hypothetical protein